MPVRMALVMPPPFRRASKKREVEEVPSVHLVLPVQACIDLRYPDELNTRKLVESRLFCGLANYCECGRLSDEDRSGRNLDACLGKRDVLENQQPALAGDVRERFVHDSHVARRAAQQW